MLCLSCSVQAQQWQDTLGGVEIRDQKRKDTLTDQRSNFTAGQQVESIAKAYRDLYEAQSVANLLAQQSSVFIKSYGVNSMATLSLRGASAAQSSVLWNGVPVLNPALGVADLSLLRTGLFDQVRLQYGGSAALFGSGNVGGALMLDDEAADFKPRKNISLAAGYGSYGRVDGSLHAELQNKRWRLIASGFYQSAQNDFRYEDMQGNPVRLANARLEGGGGLLAADYNLGKHNTWRHHEKLYLKIWLQQYDREIPPAMFEQQSVKKQLDNSLRTLLGWEKNTLRSTFYAKGAYSREYLHYEDSSVLMDNRNTVHQYYQEIGWKYYLRDPEKQGRKNTGEHLLIVYAPLQYAAASGANITTAKSQLRPALVAAYRYSGPQGKLVANAALRQEWVNGTAAPLLPGIGGTYRVLRVEAGQSKSLVQLQLRANIQRTYRIPTLNELYYFPGGNPDLKPEQGWSEDGGYTLTFSRPVAAGSGNQAPAASRFTVTHELNLFNRNIQDWIYWLGGAIWTPHNIAKVHSRGMETNNKITYRIGTVNLHLGLNYTYVLSTTGASYLPGDGSIGKQIPYTPRYNVQGNAGFEWRDRLFFNYNQTYTGYRFITVDESQFLEPYATGNVQVSYKMPAGMTLLDISLQLQNIFDTQYEVVSGRPMPGRNFLLQLKAGLFR